ncbi:MAG: 2-succinyl-5-enolpyruvyl-6-hydroxy-3-cyclohexene-1-carboxylic-acid synthase [Bernardetiaceae bacterium]|nr:2-succinyl-5-enolpyruvyl-6-hydroxy-3-cyclohexene-1-carboxylic-acid synthase [Bernardetiaceae bacterium]
MPTSNYPHERIADIPEILSQYGICHAIISPGSRSAPLTLAFARHPLFVSRVVPDERTAAFTALGIAQQTRKPVVLICTSGSAMMNYFPAVAEAFFTETPLLIFTADRPPEWIDQLDGQTVRQTELYGKHVKANFSLPVALSNPDAQWHLRRIVAEAVLLSTAFPPAPVHINAPFREPLYPNEGEFNYQKQNLKILKIDNPKHALNLETKQELAQIWKSSQRKLIVLGQQQKDETLLRYLAALPKEDVIIVSDIIANGHELPQVVRHQDLFLKDKIEQQDDSYQPDLLITMGLSIISKNLKLYLRRFNPKAHWHLRPSSHAADTFQSLERLIRISPADFFEDMAESWGHSPNAKDFQSQWLVSDEAQRQYVANYIQEKSYFYEFRILGRILRRLPKQAVLHLANSTAVRYANLLGLYPEERQVEVFANRGTSGIDGSTSTAIGHALADEHRQHFLVTGDMAFFYDRNAFWQKKLPSNLKIILLNNDGGGIFNLIKGPPSQPELLEYFLDERTLLADNIAKEFKIQHITAERNGELPEKLEAFIDSKNKLCIFEIRSASRANTLLWKHFFENRPR